MIDLPFKQLAFVSFLLFSVCSAYGAAPIQEFVQGQTATFSSAKHPKSKGVFLTISYPVSWSAEEGDRPNVLQKFVSEGGRGLEMAMIITKSLPFPPGFSPSDTDLAEALSPAELRSTAPREAVIIDARPTRIEGLPAGILEYVIVMDRVGTSIRIHAWTLHFIYGTTLRNVSMTLRHQSGLISVDG